MDRTRYAGLSRKEKYDLLTRDFLERNGDTFVRIRTEGRLGWEDTLPTEGEYSPIILNPHSDSELYHNASRLASQMIAAMNTPFRIRVQLTPNMSATDSRTVFVATEMFDDKKLSLPKKLDTFLGLTVHEGSHLLYTDFNLLRQIRNIVVGKLQNIFEDERIERRLGNDKPGLANFLKAAKYYYFARYEEKLKEEAAESAEEPHDRATDLFNAILHYVRYPARLKPETVYEFSDELLMVKDILTPYPDSTAESIEAAEKVFDLLKDLMANMPQKPDPEQMQEDLRQDRDTSDGEVKTGKSRNSSRDGEKQGEAGKKDSGKEDGKDSGKKSGKDTEQGGTSGKSADEKEGPDKDGQESGESGKGDKSDSRSEDGNRKDGDSDGDEGASGQDAGNEEPEEEDGTGTDGDTENVENTDSGDSDDSGDATDAETVNDETDDVTGNEANDEDGDQTDDDNDGDDADTDNGSDTDPDANENDPDKEPGDGDDCDPEEEDSGSGDTDPDSDPDGKEEGQSGEEDPAGQHGQSPEADDSDADAGEAPRNKPLSDDETIRILERIIEALDEASGHEAEPSKPLDEDMVAKALRLDDALLAKECDGLLEIGNTQNTIVQTPAPNRQRYLESLARVRKYIPAVAAALRSHGNGYTYNVTGTRSGLLDTNRLCEARQGVQNVYMRKGEVKADKLCVALVIDESYSMEGIREQLARDTAVLVNEAVGNIRDIRLHIYGYTDFIKNILFNYREGNAPSDKYTLGNISSRSGTPTAEAMSEASWRIRRTCRDKVLMFVVSDGNPNGKRDKVRSVTDRLQKDGFEIIGISISSSLTEESLKQMYDHYIVMTRLENLASELGKTVKKAILKASKRRVS